MTFATFAEALAYADRLFADKLADGARMMREHGASETDIADVIARAEADFMRQRTWLIAWMRRGGEPLH